ncbi:hypothetical protein C2G38_2032404 [Gigaspora rosea]|uniref:Uncharacterized protein n=1 Tax=Gigaspora rosea TaxID=44941 RepID=A0A397VPZ5_9GLOM|nr:hypothetical protein C2G38_2032404 [Gigaspora rosea]
MENKEKEHEVKYESVIEEDCPMGTRKYFAISPEGDFLVEFKVIGLDTDSSDLNFPGSDSSDSDTPDLDSPDSDSPESLDFELKMYNIKNLKNEDDLTKKKDSKQENGSKRENELNQGDEQELSYRKFSRIHTDTKSPFTKAQIDLIRNVPKPIVRWSVAVLDESANSSKFRLLAISCISAKDMEYFWENYKEISPKPIQNIQNNGLTFVFIINYDYSINNTEDKELLIKYGGIVKLFYEKDCIADQDVDDHFLIFLTFSGICKYHIKNKSTYSIQRLKYPKRIYNSIISMEAIFINSKMDFIYNYIRVCTYIQKCINKHYFLVDTIKEDIKYIELYDLKTNQLVNTFQRQILGKSTFGELPSFYAISNNGKLLAYLSFPIKGITIYSIECGLEIAELANIFDTSIFRTADATDRIFLYFFHNDEKLLIYFSPRDFSSESDDSSAVWAVWNIFNSLRDSVKLNKQKFILDFPSYEYNDKEYGYVEKSNSCMVVYQQDGEHDKLFIYDDLIVDKYFKILNEIDKQDWITRNLKDHTREFKIDKLYEPWLLREPEEDDFLYSFYLDKKKEKLLIIGNHTVQFWYRGTLKFIHSLIPFLGVPDFSDIYFVMWHEKKIEVKGIEYCSEKFKFSIQIKEDEEIKQI